MKEKILIFNSLSRAHYWFTCIVSFLQENHITFTYNSSKLEIIVGKNKIYFVSFIPGEPYLIGKRFAKIFNGVEGELDKDFVGTLKKILGD